MHGISKYPQLQRVWNCIESYAADYRMQLPEMRFFVLDSYEFISLLEKRVYPTSPMNVWEGKQVTNRINLIESGQESAIYYEVVQCGDPTYAYLNDTNSIAMQASVMAHVCGHAEFSHLNLLGDTRELRTEYVMHLVKAVDRARFRMGETHYRQFWNACASLTDFVSPLSQFSFENSVSEDEASASEELSPSQATETALHYTSNSLDSLLTQTSGQLTSRLIERRQRITQDIERQGFRLRAPCEDVFGFLMHYGSATSAERSIMSYLYAINSDSDFIIRTQIMNEGWAMYWEKTLMLDLFANKEIAGIIEYSKSVSGVCFPRPWFQRNPYQVGMFLWEDIEHNLKSESPNSDLQEDSIFSEAKNRFSSSHDAMRHIVKSCSDYEFLRRYLTKDHIRTLHLNRLPRQMAMQLGVSEDSIEAQSERFIWVKAQDVKDDMLGFFTTFHRPRVYVIDDDFHDGGLLLYHRNDGRGLREDWIKPTLQNVNMIWRRPVYLLTKDYSSKERSRGILHSFANGLYEAQGYRFPSFDRVRDNMLSAKRALD